MAAITGFHHVAIRTADFDRSVDFYTGVLGLAVKISWGEAPARAVMVDAGDSCYVEIFERADAFEAGEGTVLHFALRTDDCAAMLEKVRRAGMEITIETKDMDINAPTGVVPVRIAFFKGPDGEVVEFFENEAL